MRVSRFSKAFAASTLVLALALGGTSAAFAEDEPATAPIEVSTTIVEEAQPVVAPTPVEAPAEAAEVVEPVEQPAAAKVVAPSQDAQPVAQRTTTQTTTYKKVFVCKYVGKPGVDERLKAGKNPISVSISSIPEFNGKFPSYFADAQGRSFALAYNTGQGAPSVEACPEPDGPPVIEPAVTMTAGECIYDEDANASFKSVTLTYDNTESDTEVDFTVDAPFGDLSRTVPAGESTTVQVEDAPQAGVTYQVTAGEETFELSVAAFESCAPVTPPTPKVCTVIESGPVATNLDEAGWNHHDTRTTGAFEYVDGGITLMTTDSVNPGSSQNKATLYRSVTPTSLAEFGEPGVTFATGGSGVKPSLQVGVDVDGDGDWDGYLVGEFDSYGANNWWVNKPGFNVASGMGYTSFGSWTEFVAANPDAMVLEFGLSMGSGVLGNWTVTNLTANCISYTFDKAAPVIVIVITVVPAATAVDVCGVHDDTLDIPTDVDGIEYTADDNRVNGVGTVVVTAEAEEGFVIAEDVVTSWTFTFTDELCPEPEGPPVTPKPTPTPVTPVTPAATPPLGGANTGDGDTIALSASTSVDGGAIALGFIGVLLTIGAAVGLWATRRFRINDAAGVE